MRSFSTWRLWASAACAVATASSAFCFGLVPGDFYSTYFFGSTVQQYTPSGTLVGSGTLGPTLDSRGVAFGNDNLLYSVDSSGTSPSVHAFNAAGAILATYTISGNSPGGNISYGKIALDGEDIFVGGSNGLTHFTRGNSVGSMIYQGTDVFDVAVLPSNKLLIVSSYSLREITRTGEAVRTIATGTDMRGVAYDAATNSIFLTELGDSGAGGFFRLRKLDGTTGARRILTNFTYGDDMCITQDRRLLVGSRTQTPGIFDLNLNKIGSFTGSSQEFVTEYVVPEPAAFLALGLGFGLIWRRKVTRPAQGL